MHPALATLLYVYGALWPAWVISGLLEVSDEPMARWTYAALIGLFGMPLLHYSAAVVLGTNLGPELITSVSTATLALVFVAQRLRPGVPTSRDAATSPDAGSDTGR